MPATYLTIINAAQGLYKDKGSKFLSFAEPVASEEEVIERLKYYRKEYHDARHVCYAFVLGPDRKHYRSSDDGEPSGTAGKPILGQLESRLLTNTLVVVVRYFGGILLGTGGLVVAYRTAAAEALDNATILEKEPTVRKIIRFPYEDMNRVMKVLKDADADILKQDWQDGMCLIECEIKQEYEQRI